MTEQKTDGMSPIGRVSYPSVWKMNQMIGPDGQPAGKAKFELTLLIDKDDPGLKTMKQRAQAAIAKKWPDPAKRPKGLRSPFRDGDVDKPSNPEYEGKTFIAFRTEKKPGVVNAANEDIIDQSEFYAGCFARVTFNAYAYDTMGNKGVAFGLNNVQKVKDGEALGGNRRAARDEFEPIESDDPGNYDDDGEDPFEDDGLGLD